MEDERPVPAINQSAPASGSDQCEQAPALDADRRRDALNHNGGSFQIMINIARWFTHVRRLRYLAGGFRLEMRRPVRAVHGCHRSTKASECTMSSRQKVRTPAPANRRKPTSRAREKRPKKLAAAPVPRAANGKFLKGVSGNPSGRPAKAHEVRDLANEYSREAILKTVHIMRTSKDHSTVLAAARTILDRAVGKPMQPISSAGGAGLVNITMNNGGAIITAEDASAAYAAICGDLNADISGLTFAAPTPSQRVACPEVESLPARPTEADERRKLWSRLGEEK